MAKKKAAATPEQRLQEALVPRAEWPYDVPENWCVVRLNSVYQINPKNNINDDIDAAFIPMEKIAAGIISSYTYDTRPWEKVKKGHTHFADGDVAFAKISPCFENRKSMILENLPNGIGCGTTELIILRQSLIDSRYTFYFVSTEEFIQGGKSTYSGTVGQQRINMEYVRSYSFPLPPLNEQRRIVERIESLFARLDEAKDKAQAALDSFEPRKATLLHKAFTGELTAEWREEHGVGLESWKSVKLGNLGTLERGRSKHRPRNDSKLFGGDYPFIQTGDIANSGMYITAHKQSLSEFGMKQSKLFPKGTLCITIAANIGDVAILSYDCCFPDSVVGFTPNNLSISEFMYYMMGTLQAELEANAPATAQKNINLKVLNNLMLTVPPANEQEEIVRILDSLLAKEQQAKEAAEAVLEQIDLTKKAILSRAFRGELGTNDPSEPSAVELLQEILAQP